MSFELISRPSCTGHNPQLEKTPTQSTWPRATEKCRRGGPRRPRRVPLPAGERLGLPLASPLAPPAPRKAPRFQAVQGKPAPQPSPYICICIINMKMTLHPDA